MFGKSADYYQAQADLLKEENERLRAQVRDLQEALVAATSPAKYQQMLAERWEEKQKDAPDFEERVKEREFHQKYIEQMENPTFSGVEEFRAYINRDQKELIADLEMTSTRAPKPPDSLHGNSES